MSGPGALLLAANLRADRRRRGQLFLTLAGICLGVAVVVGIDLASDSARKSFSRSIDAVSGQATHRIRTLDGRLPEALYVQLRRELGIRAAVPIVQGRAIVAGDAPRPVVMIGTDLLGGISPTAAGSRATAGLEDLRRLAGMPGAVVATSEFPAGPETERLTLAFPRPGYALTIVGYNDNRDWPQNSLFADIATAQEALGMVGSLTRVDLWLLPEQAQAVDAWLPAGVILEPAEMALARVDELSRSFRINLQALALLALMVGGLLVFSTVAYSVVRRRRQFGILRCLGMHRLEIIRMILLETLVLAAIGSIAGVGLGVLLGAGLVDLFTRTVTDLYASVSGGYNISIVPIVKGLLLGMSVSTGSALAPAVEAASVRPRQATLRVDLERRSRRAMPGLALGSVILAVCGAAVLASEPGLSTAFVGIFLVIVASALATPVFAIVSLRAIGFLAGRASSVGIAYAARNLAAGLSRTGPAMAALAVAVAATIGMGVMVTSFRSSFQSWLDYTIDADISVRVGASGPGTSDAIEDFVATVPGMEGVSDVSLVRRVPLPDGEGLARLHAIRPAWRESAWPLLRSADPDWTEAFASGSAVLISESYATRSGLTNESAVGSSVVLDTVAGARSFPVAGVFIDYTTDRGVVAMALDTYRALWQDDSLTSIGVYVVPGKEAIVEHTLSEFVDARPSLAMASGDAIRSASLAIFDRTFTITDVLRVLAAIVALLAVANSLNARLLDNRREYTLLRAQGLSRRRLIALLVTQNLLFGGLTGLAAIVPGYLLAWLLINVVNRIAFGWSMEFLASPGFALEGLALAIIAAVLAGVPPLLGSFMRSVRPELQPE